MTIRRRIALSFLGVIILYIISLASVLVFHISTISEYQLTSNELTLEYELTLKVEELIEAHSAELIAFGDSDRAQSYQVKREELFTTLAELDELVVHENSRVAYRGLKNIILAIVDDLEKSRAAISEGDLVNSAKYHSDAVAKRAYVQPNVTTLLLTEIEHLNQLQDESTGEYQYQLLVVLLWVVTTVLLTILYALIVIRQVISPIKILSRTAEQVIKGNYAVSIQQDLLEGKDEVAKLANSFNEMLQKLNTKITQIEANNSVILETQDHLRERNEELERFNSMVTGRELKMMELKNTIRELEAKIEELEADKH